MVTKSLTAAGGALAGVGHANGGVSVGAETAKGALGKVQPGQSLAVEVLMRDGAGGADRRGGASVLPMRPIDFRPSAGAARYFRGCRRVVRRDDAGGEAFAEDA